MTVHLLERIRRESEGPESWQWYVGVARILVLPVVVLGAFIFEPRMGLGFLLGFYLLGFVSAVWYLLFLQRQVRSLQVLSNWAQVLIDFGVVAATVGFTGGPTSFLAFLFVIVILESGLILSMGPSFLLASFATLFMVIQTFSPPDAATLPPSISLWYNVLIQGLAFYLTAFISSYWNQRIHRMQQFQHELLDNMNNGFLITDNRGVIIVQNKGADRILGLKEGESVSRPVQEVLRVDSGGECPVVTALRSKRDFTSYEFHVLVGAGETKLLGLTTNTMYDTRGNVNGIIASFTDLTEMARMRQELQRQDRLAVVGELATGLAHEIRNPLAAIRGAVEELRGSLSAPPVAERLVGIALREADQLNQIVTGFLDFARKPSTRRENFDVCQLVEEVCDLLRPQYDDAPLLSIRADCPPLPCVLSGDRGQIKQVFLNICKNAIEAMDARGGLLVTVTPSQASAEIRFDDEGPGIDPDKVARIFEPFYTTKDSGVGMGLAVCLRIITAHDGAIRVASRQGRGASISVRLPAAKPDEPVSPADDAAAADTEE
ncbi:MAG: PAS domain S-box protein [Candidatus Hydrogenedentes bacterium]|nr:PAS domain S-box protein [Candidatus Hydrogenedentota bacterium]